MKLTKKLLTALLPIATTGAVVPAVTSCNKGNGYVINYGDEINCLDETAKNYHSLNDVKNAIKSHVSVEESKTIPMENLPVWGESTQPEKQMMYFDLIASLSIMENWKFHLIFNEKASEDNFVLTYVKDGQTITAKGKIIAYGIYDPEKLDISLSLQTLSSGDWVKTHSYAFKNSKAV